MCSIIFEGMQQFIVTDGAKRQDGWKMTSLSLLNTFEIAIHFNAEITLVFLNFEEALYQELGEKGNEYQRRNLDDLQKRLADAHSSVHHIELVERVKLLVHQLHKLDIG